MDYQSRQSPAGRSRLLRASSTAAAGLMIAGVGGTAAAAAFIAHQQQTADIQNGGHNGRGSRIGTSGNGSHATTGNQQNQQLPGLSSGTGQQPVGGSNGS